MGPDELRRRCLAKPGAAEDFPFNEETSVFKVAGKVFAISTLDGSPLTVSLKCDPEEAQALRAAHPAVRPGYHLNKRHWNTVVLDGSIPDDEVGTMIDDSYDLVVAALTGARRQTLRFQVTLPARSPQVAGGGHVEGFGSKSAEGQVDCRSLGGQVVPRPESRLSPTRL